MLYRLQIFNNMIRIINLKSKYVPLAFMASGRYKLLFGFEPYYEVDEDGNKVETDLGTWYETWLSGKPTLKQIKEIVINAINKDVDDEILSGFVWKDMPVWLSTENQFNYKAAYDLAVMSQGKSLPVLFKFGTTENPIYHTFETLEDISDFYLSAMAYISKTLEDGWIMKDSIDWSEYEEALKNL